MAETLFNLGYVGFAVEPTPGVAAIPTDYGQAYDSSLTTARNFEQLAPAAGNVYGTQQVVAGLRDHTGDMTLIFEPNTAEKVVNMMLLVSAKTGSDPYTSTGTLSPATPKTYTIDVSSGTHVQRYFGCQVSKLSPEFGSNEVKLKPTISAIGSFNGREIASIAGTTPYVITLKTDYDPAPATGIVVGDIMQVQQAAGTTINFTVSAVTATTISTTTNVAAAAAADFVYIRPASPSFAMLPPILWSNTQFCFGATASAALAATQTQVDPSSKWELTYDFKDNKGEHRSGSQDPATLLRKPAMASLTIKKAFFKSDDVEKYNNMAKTACVVRHFVYFNSKVYEFRVTLNNLTTDSPLPKYKAGEINYSEIKYIAKQDTGDGQAFSVTMINSNVALT